MPRFAANLAYLFTERPLIERFAAAAAAGFKAVELQLPYDHAPSAVKAEIDRHGLTQLGVNTPLGREGENNIPLLTEPINPRDRPDYFLTRVEHAADVIAKVDRPNVRLQFDFY